MAFNLSVVIGPAIGGLLAARSYLLLFLSDAALSLLTVILIAIFLPETKPQAHPDARTRYMAGLIIDGPKPYLLWYAAGFVGMLSTFALLALYRIKNRQEQKVQTMPEVMAL